MSTDLSSLSSPWPGTPDTPYERGVALRDNCEPGTLLCGRGFRGTVEVVRVDASSIWAKYDGGVARWSLYDAGMDLFLALDGAE